MDGRVVLGIDVGSSRIKVAAFARDGSLRALAARPTPVRTGGGFTDFPILAVLDQVCATVLDLGLEPDEAIGAGIATVGELGTALADGALVDVDFPAWHDTRGSEIAVELEARFGARELASRTGGHLRSVSTVAKLGWYARAHGPLRGRFVGLAEALAWRLTGEVGQDASLAVTTGAFDPLDGSYLHEVWASAGLAELDLSPVTPPGHGSPAVTALARDLGIRRGSPIVVAGHDHPVAAVGSGAAPGDVVDSMGTGEPLIAAWQGPPRAKAYALIEECVDDGMSVEAWPSTDLLALIGEGLRPGLAMETFLRATDGDRAELDRNAPPPGESALLARAEIDALDGGRSTLAPGPESWARIVDTYAALAAVTERSVRARSGASGRVVLTGGGIRSRRWVAAKRAASESELVVSSVQETVARGAAAIAGSALGWWSEAAAMPGSGLVRVADWLGEGIERSQNGHVAGQD